jgi:enoyl-CoA hydratase
MEHKMNSNKISIKYLNSIAIIEIDSPPSNMFSKELILELNQAFEELENKKNVRCIVLESKNQKIFLSGGDLRVSKDMVISEDIKNYIEYIGKIQAVVRRLEKIPKPTVAVIAGHAIGGGFELIMACDYRLGLDSEKIVLGMPEVDVGFIPGLGGMERVSRKFGQHLALKMALGTRLSIQEAASIGIVDEVYTSAILAEKSLEFAHKLASLPTKAVGMIKYILQEGAHRHINEINKMELECLKMILQTKDLKEGICAFLEKRHPNFKGE